ncbi:hypothetical protein PRIPAC_84378 [Pristionchus pacificus]|uniref:Protein kinase domain-containing protein n=1 Tax=Pristionchus pacificus TaxID=54126 RepID=A0A2A6BNM3_PRIPA|nr:hypothetical protein PRIPAC_84378 [Pristionchus pacificus]|eukprot:PDM67517.1 protein kinase [Pristionchus pacificus]
MPSEPPPEIKIAIGDKIADGKYIVKKKLGEGSCGQVYLVHDKNENSLAMKVEAKMKNREEEILKMEIYVLKKMQNSKHVCRFYSSGVQSNYSFVIMSLLGNELSELRRRCPGRRMCHSSVLRIAIQAVTGVEDMHNVGFIHRDLKPTNLAIGNKLKHAVFLFDFGLARQIMTMKDGKLTLREPRKKVSFRGTVRYCSINVHQAKEQGRHDDLWSILHSMIELATGTLPWKGSTRKDAEKIKSTVTEKQLFRGVPRSLLFLYKQLLPLQYADTPNYAVIKGAIAKEIKAKKVSMTDSYEWEKGSTSGTYGGNKEKDTNKDAAAEADKGADNDTNKDVDENAQSATSELSNNESINDYDIENTLENVADVKESFRETRDDKT